MGCNQSVNKPVAKPTDTLALATSVSTATAAVKGETAKAENGSVNATTTSNGTASKTTPASSTSPDLPSSSLHLDQIHPIVPSSSTSSSSSSLSPPQPIGGVRPLVICGPSGVGKGTLLSRLLKEYPKYFSNSISHTTRAPRPVSTRGRCIDTLEVGLITHY